MRPQCIRWKLEKADTETNWQRAGCVGNLVSSLYNSFQCCRRNVLCFALIKFGFKPMNKRLTAVIQRENDGFVALCPELDIGSQGDSIQTARDNLREALELFFECASPDEISDRLGEDVFVTHVEVSIA